MTDQNDLELLIRGHTPIIAIESHEELRALDYLLKAAITSTIPLFKWSVTEGLQRLDIDLGAQKNMTEAQSVLRHIKSAGVQGMYAYALEECGAQEVRLPAWGAVA